MMSTLLIQAVASPENTHIAETAYSAVEWLRIVAEITGALIIGLGVLVALVGFLRALMMRHTVAFTDVRLTLGRYLALALEFQLGADILTTGVSPSWDQIGKLGAIAVIRTALNFFLTRELRDTGRPVSSSSAPESADAARVPIAG